MTRETYKHETDGRIVRIEYRHTPKAPYDPYYTLQIVALPWPDNDFEWVGMTYWETVKDFEAKYKLHEDAKYTVAEALPILKSHLEEILAEVGLPKGFNIREKVEIKAKAALELFNQIQEGGI